jgi:hypothetical protein
VFISFLYIVSSNPVLTIRRINRINTSSGVYHSVQVAVWYGGQRGTDGEHWVALNNVEKRNKYIKKVRQIGY